MCRMLLASRLSMFKIGSCYHSSLPFPSASLEAWLFQMCSLNQIRRLNYCVLISWNVRGLDRLI